MSSDWTIQIMKILHRFTEVCQIANLISESEIQTLKYFKACWPHFKPRGTFKLKVSAVIFPFNLFSVAKCCCEVLLHIFSLRSLSKIWIISYDTRQTFAKIFWCWWQSYLGDRVYLGDIFWIVTTMVTTINNMLKLSPTHFVSNIRHQHRFHRFEISIYRNISLY